jgi:hypothetical protein
MSENMVELLDSGALKSCRYELSDCSILCCCIKDGIEPPIKCTAL